MFKTLVVEDNESFRESFINLLGARFSAMSFEKASSTEEALQKISSFLPQLVFVDIQLPGENGLQLARKIRSSYRETTIIMFTNHDGPEYRQAANQCGANYFISKGGASIDEIIEIVDSVVNAPRMAH